MNTPALKLLTGFDKHIFSGILLYQSRDNCDREFRRSDFTGFTGLHGIAYLGIVETAASLLEVRKWDLDATDAGGSTAFLWAVKRGHEGMVKMLLEREDVAPNTADKDGRTPLSWAAGEGHEGVVKMLLKRGDVAPNAPDKSGRTPLARESESRHEDVVKMILEPKEFTPNTRDEGGRTPLSWAAHLGNKGS